MTHKSKTKIFSNSFTELLPYSRYEAKESGWRDGMVTGNGENGVVCSCSPYLETLIYQNISFIMPSRQPRVVPKEVTAELNEARQAVINFDDSWNVHDRNRTSSYCYHPGHQLRLNMSKAKIIDYIRYTDYQTAEVCVKYTDKNGTWIRKTFSSREDNVIITEIKKSDKDIKINVVISIDDVSSMIKFGNGNEAGLQYKKLVDEECSYISMVAHYPEFDGSELAFGGYAGATRVIAVGGVKRKVQENHAKEDINVGAEKNPAISITGADAVYLITVTSRTHNMGPLKEFALAGKYNIVDELLHETEEVANKYTDASGIFSYAFALKPHAKKQSALFNGVSFCLGSDMDKDSFNEELINKQRNSKSLNDAIVERAYNQGRYAQICCSGFSAPRLCGLWTGEWGPGWNGAYTMDANVNLQVSGLNTGNVYDAAIGYIYFILRQIKDWEENAAFTYGMQDALQVPVNTDGDRAMMVEYDQYYPFQYWNAGASWMILPIFEFWQCFGNRKIPVNNNISHIYKQEYLDLEKDILLPLLTKQSNFWEQLCTPEYFTDIKGKACYEKGKKELSAGEKYLIIPSYSPENKPNGYNSTITANAAMDISAARDGLNMTIAMEKSVARDGYEKTIEKWEQLKSRLPEYKYDETGALCEWAMDEYKENNVHRHISHLYCAWPAYEAQNNEKLINACSTAIANRNRENIGKDDTASHGWVHKALVAARLKSGESTYDLLHTIMSSNIYFTSLMTDHNTDRSVGVFCTDTSIGTVGIINEMLLYSYTGEIELLPALPEKWTRGSICGLMARTNAKVTKLEWNLDEGTVEVSIRSYANQTIKLTCRAGKGSFVASNGLTYTNGAIINFAKDEEINFNISM